MNRFPSFKSLLEMKIIVLLSSFTVTCGFDLTILHTNDVHARFEKFNKYGSECSENDACFGGVARRSTKIQEIRGSHDNVLLLDAGDQFVGTAWFSVYLGNATSFFMNELGYDAMCLGNHEFDGGVDWLVPFLDSVSFPVVSANLDATNEPRMRGKFQKTWISNIDGEQIAVIGFTTPNTEDISSPGPTLKITDIVSAVRVEVLALQAQGVNKIIALGHAGFSDDKQVAAIDGVDLVIGGHTNTFLYNGDQPAGEAIEGPYPIVIDQAGGGRGLVVQDYKLGKYLGYLNLTFDSKGMVTAYSGNPILLDDSVQEDTRILQLLQEWNVPVDEIGKIVVGYSNVLLDAERDVCLLQECNLGNLITDAIIDFHVNFSHPESQWAPASIALWNGGGIRASIDKGVVSTREAMSVMPFGNGIDLVTVSGEDLRKQLEHSVRDFDREDPYGRFLQMSGLRVVYNLQKPAGERVVSAEVRCLVCDIPSYSPLKDYEDYDVFLSTFLLNGGDGYSFVPSKHQRFNTLDLTPVTEYFKKHSPVYAATEGRIQFHSDYVIANASKLSTLSFTFFILLVALFHQNEFCSLL